MRADLEKILKSYEGKKGVLIPILQEAQRNWVIFLQMP